MNTTKGFGAMLVLVVVAIIGIGGFVFLREKSSPQTSPAPTAISPASPLADAKSPAPEAPPQKTETAATPPKGATKPTPPTVKTQDTASKFLTLQFVNQYGVTYSFIYAYGQHEGPYLLDALGDKVPGTFNEKREEKGRFNLYTFDKELPAGTYSVGWYGGRSAIRQPGGKESVERYYSTGTQKITVPKNGDWFVSVPIEQTGIEYFNNARITFTTINELGTMINCSNTGSATVYNSQGKRVSDAGGYDGGICEASLSTPPGTHTLKLRKTGYQPKDVNFTLPDVSSWTDEKVWSSQPGFIDLGKIVLKKI